MKTDSFENLPGAELVIPGLADLAAGRETEAAFLVAAGASRLRDLGIEVEFGGAVPDRPEHALYDLLSTKYGDDAHSRYNAVIQRLVSFMRGLEAGSRS